MITIHINLMLNSRSHISDNTTSNLKTTKNTGTIYINDRITLFLLNRIARRLYVECFLNEKLSWEKKMMTKENKWLKKCMKQNVLLHFCSSLLVFVLLLLYCAHSCNMPCQSSALVRFYYTWQRVLCCPLKGGNSK